MRPSCTVCRRREVHEESTSLATAAVLQDSPSQAASQWPGAVFQPPTASPAQPSTHAGGPNDRASPVPHEQVVGIIHAVAAGRQDQLAFGARCNESPLHTICSFWACELAAPHAPGADCSCWHMAAAAPDSAIANALLALLQLLQQPEVARHCRGMAATWGVGMHDGAGADVTWVRSRGAKQRLTAASTGWNRMLGSMLCCCLQPSLMVGQALGGSIASPLAAGG